MASSDSLNQPSPEVDVPQENTTPVEAPAAPAKRKRDAAAPRTGHGAKLADHSDGPKTTKAEVVLKKLKSAKGATIEALMETTGWQAHSVRGAIAGALKKKHGLATTSEPTAAGRIYRVAAEQLA